MGQAWWKTNATTDGLLRSLHVGERMQTLEQHSYAHDLANQLKQLPTACNQSPQTQLYSYDDLGRLQTVTDGLSNPSYSLDAVGNRVSESSAGLSRQYTLDQASSRFLSSFSTQSGDTGHQYQYDALGNRIGERVGTQTCSYRYTPV